MKDIVASVQRVSDIIASISEAAADMLKDQASRLDAVVQRFALADTPETGKVGNLGSAGAAQERRDQALRVLA